MTDAAGRTEAGPEARDAARAIVERHGTSDCSCLRDEFPCEKCHMAIEDIVAALSRPAPEDDAGPLDRSRLEDNPATAEPRGDLRSEG